MAIRLKTPEQIEGIRKSAHLARHTLKYIGQFVQPGVTTAFINQKVEEFIKDHGATSATLGYKGAGNNAYPASCCISPNEVICHGVPGPYIIREGDILNVDVTTILNGYYGDTCTMYAVGEISPNAQRLLDAALRCLDIGIGQCYPGNRVGNIGYNINEYARSQGYSVVYEFCGHGVGLAFHEEPEVCHADAKNSGPVMKPGMTFTIEPMINEGKARAKVDKRDKWTARTIDNKLSAQYEHTILITEDGVDVLSDIDGEYDAKGARVAKADWYEKA